MNFKFIFLFIFLTTSVLAQDDDVEQLQNLESDTGNEKPAPEPEDNDKDPMTSNVAPTDDYLKGNIANPYRITEQRLKEIRALKMYPYYNRGGNVDDKGDYQTAIQQSTPQVFKNLNFQLPFFGFRFNYTRVSLNGYLEFSDPPPVYENYPLTFPNKNWPKENDPSFIGIWFSKCKIGKLQASDVDQRDPGVYFRMERDLRGRTDRLGVELYERVKWDIRESIVGSDTFDPKHMIIVTWKNITFNGAFSNAIYQTNTFQLILATDEVFTYAIFNYNLLTWTTPTDAGGSSDRGEGGTAALVGFNAGNGTRSYEYRPYSQNSVIRDLSSTGWANGFPGRHIFRIDEDILLGNCNKDIDAANLPLVFAPESGNMLGGTIVNITGPCFTPEVQVRCVFDVGNVVYGVFINKNRVVCVQPRILIEGWIDLEIAVGNDNFKYKGKYYVENPATAAQKIFFKDKSIYDKAPREIPITWNPQNLTTNTAATLHMSIWGYRESKRRPEFLYIGELANGVSNQGFYNIQPSDYRNVRHQYMDDITFGFIQINVSEPFVATVQKDNTITTQTIDITHVIWSRPVPLQWYFAEQWRDKYGEKWPVALCDNWLMNDRYLKNFAHELPMCPCTLEQALADKGRFLPDLECDKDTNRDCPYNDKAVHCVKTGSPTLEGAEQQCCYDKNEYLMLTYDQQWGSTPRRCHNLGLLPWDENTKVPTLSQWYHDIIPKYMCCLWQEDQSVSCETLRFERRPTQDCVAYQAPGIAGIYGDPHILTFDDYAYTFNGKGEYVLLKTVDKQNNLEIQGRFEQMPINAFGEVKATQLTGVVAKGNSSTIIEIRRRPHEARWRYRLDVIANGKKIYFDRPSLKFQHYPGVTVYTPSYIYNQSEVIVMFDTGAGLEVVENEGFLSARVYLPWTFINKTKGLLGNWSFNQLDDFVLPDGSVAPMTLTDDSVSQDMKPFFEFAQKWMLDDTERPNIGRSMFFREFGRTAATYNNVTWQPQFSLDPSVILPPNLTMYRTAASEVCVELNRECLYDYAMTLNKDLAHYTNNYKASIKKLKEITRKQVITCGVLETPRFGRKSNYFFIPGSKVTFECNTDFVLIGDSRRTCMPNGQWDIPEYGYTYCLRQQEYSSRKAAITWGIILAVIVPIILLLLFIGYRWFKSNAEDDGNNTILKGNPYSRSTTSLSRSAPVKEVNNSDEGETDESTEDEDIMTRPRSNSSSSKGSKKRRSYDKTYRTHEPLPNRPNITFPEKPIDGNDEYFQFSPSSSVIGSNKPGNSTLIQFSPISSPEPTDKNGLRANKPRTERYSSQSSTVTDV
ncbi:protein mesh isoform X3 [Aethina tumida]|uniref:protein mesh isoform X3 n=1 Tax=Aethina tumida TaxID=116153 RepID=UPI002149029E|nr:protein mesh isoform X3 [Aethina tumida]